MDKGAVNTPEPAARGRGGLEQVISLPTGAMLAAVMGGPIALAGGWWAIAAGGGWTNDVVMAGPAGAGVVAMVAAISVLLMTPWKPREMSWWMTLWLAATVVRLLATPLCTWLLYSAAPLNGMALTLAVATAYLIALFTEAAVIARRVYRSLPS